MKATATHPLSTILFITTLCLARPVVAQNTRNVNVNVDNNMNVFSNNVNVQVNQSRNAVNNTSTGNQQVPLQQAITLPLNNGRGPNGPGPNAGVYALPAVPTQQAAVQSLNKPKAPKRVVNRTRTATPKPATNLAYAPKPKPKPATPKRPAAGPTVTAPAVNAPLIQQTSSANNPVVVVNALVMNTNDQTVIAPEQMTTVNLVSAPVTTIVSAGSTRMGSRSVSSGSSGSSAHRKPKSKRHNGFCYTANKKMTKFFAKTRKSNFDPAKCFVWK